MNLKTFVLYEYKLKRYLIVDRVKLKGTITNDTEPSTKHAQHWQQDVIEMWNKLFL